MKSVICVLVLSAAALAQHVPKESTVTKVTAASGTNITVLPVPHKNCAFGLQPQLVEGPGKQKPPTNKEIFESALHPYTATFAIEYYRASCPYERAIELFGEDRVSFVEDITGKHVQVDGETVYTENDATTERKK